MEKVGGGGVKPSSSEKDQTWIPKMIKKRMCSTFVEDSFSNGALCQCGEARQSHAPVALGDYFGTAIVNHWDSAQHSTEYPTDAFGELQFAGASRRQSYFLRLSLDTAPATIYRLMTAHWGLPLPNLVVSLVGGEGRAKVKTWVREVLRQGLVKASQSTGAWLLTGGLREGVGRCVGEAVRDHATAASSVSLNKVVALGIAPWGLVHNRQQLVNPKGSFPAKYYVQNTSRDSCCLDNNYQAFLLVDDGSVGRRGGETSFRAKLEDFISRQRTGISGSGSMDIPVLCMLVAGEKDMLERMDMSLKKSIPWLVLAASGGVADLVSDMLETLSSAPLVTSTSEGDGEAAPSVDLKDRVTERVREHFGDESNISKLVEQAMSIYQNRGLITVYHGEQEGPDDFDTVLLKALVRASKQRASSNFSPYIEELKLAVTWNRVDIARSELFNGGIQWRYEDLKDSMTDALVNDKPEFVRLFTENGLNIFEYLTCGQLENLYRSVDDSTLAYRLLLRRLEERQYATGSPLSQASMLEPPASRVVEAGQLKDISLYEVSKVLEDLMGDVCQPFYLGPLELENVTTRRKALKHVSNLLCGDCLYRRERCLFPWASLFIWAVLQNHSKMAEFFWEMSGESVLSALSGCKLLRELSKLESETDTKLSMKELAQRFENLAHDVFSQCYQSSESRSFTLLIRMSSVWQGTTCLQMGVAADARLFFSHDGVQALLSQIWWGDMESSTEVWKLLLTFFCPALLYSQLISFRDVEGQQQEETTVEAPGRDTDHLYGTTVFSFSDIKHIDVEPDAASSPKSPFMRGTAHSQTIKRPFVVARWRQFWFSPVTAFLGNVLMYFVFLLLFAYMLLVDFKPPPDGPAIAEFILYFWVFTIVCEEIRETFFVGSMTMKQRMRKYIRDFWNKCDLTAVSLFLIGTTCRMFKSWFEFGRAVLCVDYMVFTLRLIHIFAFHKQLGPKIIIVGKMMKDIFFFLFFLGVWLMAYGVANQALIYPYDPRPAWIFRRVFYRPYLHIFGQIPVEEIDALSSEWDHECTHNVTLVEEGANPCRSHYANWLVVVLLVVYLLVTNILLINLLIAMFSYTFNKVQENSDTYWKFQRYNLIVEYHSRPSLAPPFIILSHLHLFIKRHIRKVASVKIHHFVLELRGRVANRLMTWESIQKENFLTAQSKIQRASDSERLKRMSVKVDSVLKQLAVTRDLDRRLRALETEMEYSSNALSWIVDSLSHGTQAKPPRPPPTVREAFPSSTT